MLTDARILVTGASGLVGKVLCKHLAPNNEVWGVARFADVDVRARVESWGVRTVSIDLAAPNFTALPAEFDYVVHLAAYMSADADFDSAITTSAEGTGLLLSRYHAAKAALVMSTASVYAAHPDPWHLYTETDPLGAPTSPSMPTYPVAKIAEEAVARACSRMFGLRVVIARLNNLTGPSGGLALKHLRAMVAGEPIRVRSDPIPYSPVFEADLPRQLEKLIGAASSPATIVNWGGDDAVSVQQWCDYLANLLDLKPHLEVRPLPGSQLGVAQDNRRRLAITGPATPWRVAMRELVQAHNTAAS